MDEFSRQMDHVDVAQQVIATKLDDNTEQMIDRVSFPSFFFFIYIIYASPLLVHPFH